MGNRRHLAHGYRKTH